MTLLQPTKSFNISKGLIYEAYKRVKANKGSGGVDGQSLEDFEQRLSQNLYKLWNRLSSGSYFPQAVKRVDIPKADGGMRPLGIPTVADRIAQMAVKMQIEPELESHFHPDSYGYRPGKSAHQALEIVRKRCWKRAWVLDMDIKGFFDAIDHQLLQRAIDKHVKLSWQRLYIKRWLEAPVQHADGHLEERTQGTPQGGVISPLLANLFLHYVFDVWVGKHWKGIEFARYADDIICHCRSEQEAIELQALLTKRFNDCGLQLHPVKTKIVLCKDWKRKVDFDQVSFDFLGFTFRPRLIKASNGKRLVYFLPAISQAAAKRIREQINQWSWLKWSQNTIMDIIWFSRNKIRGWMEYYGKFGRGAIINVLFHFDLRLTRWAMRKFKSVKTLMQGANRVGIFRNKHRLFLAHWNRGRL